MSVNSQLKKVVGRVKAAQVQLQGLLRNKTWVEDARKYAERQGKEVKKLLTADAGKVKIFLERERKELERLQKQIPGEVKKLKKYVNLQRKEFEKLLSSVRKTSKANGSVKKKSTSKKKSTNGSGKKSESHASA